MSGISDALSSSANNLRNLNRSLNIIQSNVGNASTPGYARQDVGELSTARQPARCSSRARATYLPRRPCSGRTRNWGSTTS